MTIFFSHFAYFYLESQRYRTLYKATANLGFCTSTNDILGISDSTPLINPAVFFDDQMSRQGIVNIYVGNVADQGNGFDIMAVTMGSDSFIQRQIVQEELSRFSNWRLTLTTLNISNVEPVNMAHYRKVDISVFALKSMSLVLNYCIILGAVTWLLRLRHRPA